jgi:tetratricopeptide (TPR) repeat protein
MLDLWPRQFMPSPPPERVMRAVRRVLPAVLVFGCVTSVGCLKWASQLGVGAGGEPERPATEDECRAFGAELEAAAAAGDEAKTAELFNLAGLFYKSVSDFEGPPEFHAQLRKRTADDARIDPMVPLLLEGVRRGGQLKLLRVHTVDGRPRALVRYIGPRGGVDYMDFLPVRRPDGRVVAEDFYSASNGELQTQSLRRIRLKVAAELKQGPPGHPPSAAKLWAPHVPKLNAMFQASRARKYSQAVGIYRSLPEEMRADKSVSLYYLWAAEAVSDTEFLLALEWFRRQFPGDPALAFQDVDYYCLTRNFDDALRSIDRAEKAIGGDPYLNALRAKLLVKAWRHPEARVAADKAIAEEPGLTHGYWGRIDVALAETHHADTLKWLQKLVENTGQAVGDLRKDPDFVVFVRSPEYQEWLKWYAGRKKV